MQKILVRIQSNTLILTYQVKSGLVRKGSGWEPYIQVLSSSELSRFDLRGLSPDMFCTNIADTVNVRGKLSGVVENEQQLPVAHWKIDREDYRQTLSTCTLNHRQMVALLDSLPDYVSESDEEFIEFETVLAPRNGNSFSGGYRLTVVTRNIGARIAPYAIYNLDTFKDGEWQAIAPPAEDQADLRALLDIRLNSIIDTGVPLTQADDVTDYT
ncbi:MAG: hypothetical protein ACYC43_12280 [Burkholderiales bacterium]